MAVSAVLIVIPGPSVLFIVGRALALGRSAALATVISNASGEGVQGLVAALGFGYVIQRSPAAFTVLKVCGAAYLLYLAWHMLRHRREAAAGSSAEGSRRPARDGFIVGVTNPKSAVFFAIVMPQFADTSLGHVTLQLVVMALIYVSIALLSDGVWALAASRARQAMSSSPRAMVALATTGGVFLLGLAVAVVFTGVPR